MTKTDQTEQSSQSEGTTQKKITFEPLSQPWLARIPVDPEEVKVKIDEVWEKSKEEFVRASRYKGKKGKKGKVNYDKARPIVEKTLGFGTLYYNALANWGGELIKKETKKPILLVNSVQYDIEDPESILLMDIYPYPELHVDGDIDMEIPKSDLPSEKSQLETRIKGLQSTQRIREDMEDGDCIDDNTEVVIDLFAKIDGVSYLNGTVKLHRTEVEFATPPELKSALIGKKSGDRFIITFENEMEDEFKGKEVEAEIVIQDCCRIKDYPVDGDDLYKASGYASQEDFSTKFKEEYETYTKNAERENAYSTIMDHLVNDSRMDPIPPRYVEASMNNFLGQMGKDVDPGVASQVKQQIYAGIVNKMAENCYIDENTLSRDIEHDTLVDHIMEHITYKY